MQTTCPDCHKICNFDADAHSGAIICSQCGAEITNAPEITQQVAEMQINSVQKAPQPEAVHLWPWLLTALLLLLTASIWIQKDAWLDNRWMRSQLFDLHLPLQTREKDWLIVPESVRSEWIYRDDGGRILVISGVIENLLDSRLAYPEIEVAFFSISQPEKAMERRDLPISEKTDIEKLKTTSQLPERLKYASPLGSSEFVLVIETVPENLGDLTLAPKVR